MDCFVAEFIIGAAVGRTRWLLAMTSSPHATSQPRDAMCPGRAFISRPLEGVGNAGCPLHPRFRGQCVLVERTRVTTSRPESPSIPARNGFTAYVVLSPVTGLFCHRRFADIVLSLPGWADRTPQNLTPASGRQDHTILPSAATSLVSVLLIAHKSL